MISRLRSPIGCVKKEVADDFDVSERTIERHMNLLRDLGFDIIKTGNRFKIEGIDNRALKHENLIGFSLEEATVIKNALLAGGIKQPLQKSVIDKIYALSELDELAETIYNQTVSKNIAAIRGAIKSQEQIVLKHYQSVSSKLSRDYHVEPIRFYNYFQYLVAYDIKAGRVKQFKTERVLSVENTGLDWQNLSAHKQFEVDVFGMGGEDEIAVKLKLTKRSHHLLIEEYPDAIQDIRKYGGEAYYEGRVRSVRGVGRFVMGLLDEIEVIEPQELKDYIRKIISNF